MPYGDQGLFLSAGIFHETGGYPEIPIMEDYAFVRRFAGKGDVRILPVAVSTSARRWEKLGVWRTTLLNQVIIIAYHCGVPPDRLAAWYRRKR